MKINDKVYDILKWIVMIVLPALNVCITAILTAVNVDPDVVTTISTIMAAVTVFLGTVLGISTVSYYKSASDEETTSEDIGA